MQAKASTLTERKSHFFPQWPPLSSPFALCLTYPKLPPEGKSEGLVTVLRSVPYHALSRRRVYLPNDLMAEQRASAEAVLRGQSPAEVIEAVCAESGASRFRHGPQAVARWLDAGGRTGARGRGGHAGVGAV